MTSEFKIKLAIIIIFLEVVLGLGYVMIEQGKVKNQLDSVMNELRDEQGNKIVF